MILSNNFQEVLILPALSIIGQRFKLVRAAYGLSLQDMASSLGVKSKATIFRIEENKALLSIELLNRFSKIFSLSYDWIFGIADNPYIESYILENESILLDVIEIINTKSNSCELLANIPSEYLNYNLRITHFSLSVRANIIFLLHIFLISYLNNLITLDLLQNDLINMIKENGFSEFDTSISDAHLAKVLGNQENLKCLVHLLASRNQDTEPCFKLG